MLFLKFQHLNKRQICALLLMLIVFNQYSASVSITEKTITKTYLIDKVLKLLTKWDHSTNLNINIKFSALLSEFLIKRLYCVIEEIKKKFFF